MYNLLLFTHQMAVRYCHDSDDCRKTIYVYGKILLLLQQMATDYHFILSLAFFDPSIVIDTSQNWGAINLIALWF